MKQIWKLAWSGLKSRKRSSLLLLATIILSVVFLVLIGLIGSSAIFTMDKQNKDLYGEQKVVAWNVFENQISQIKQQPIWNEIGTISVNGCVTSTSDTLLGIGTMDKHAIKLGHIRLVEGKLPQEPNEIVLEKSVYKHIGNEKYHVGDRITLNVVSMGKEERQQRVYRVVGFIDNYTAVWKSAYTYNSIEDSSSPLPISFILSEQGAKDLSDTEISVVLLLNSNSSNYSSLNDGIPKKVSYSFNYSTYPNICFHGGLGEETLGIIGISTLIGGIIMICMIVILLNGFQMSVDKRKRQFALLRSIGGTKKQAYSYIFCEAIILICFGVPIGVGIGVLSSFGVVKLFSALNNIFLLYHFNGWVLVFAIFICVLCVFISVLIPAIHASKSAPIVGTRTVYFRNKRTTKKLCKTSVILSPFTLMTISLKKSKIKAALTTIIFTLAIVVFNVMILSDITANQLISNRETPGATLISSNTSITKQQEILWEHNPKIETIPISAFSNFRNSPNISYQNATAVPMFYCRVPFSHYDSYLNGYFHYDYKMLGIQHWKSWGQFSYNFEKQLAFNYTNTEYLIEPNITIYDNKLLNKFSLYVTDGRIDVDAINLGEEIILCMPDYALTIKEEDNGLQARTQLVEKNNVIPPNSQLHTNRNWRAGDSLTFTWVEMSGDGEFKTLQKTVKIGAIVYDAPPVECASRNVFGIAVGEQTLSNLQLPYEISNLQLYFNEEADISSTEAEIKQKASQAYSFVAVSTQTEEALAQQQQRRTTLAITGMLTICLLALGFLGLMNTVSNRIYNRMHEIGLLRCIGMTKGQIYRMFIYEAVVYGVLASLLGVAVCALILPNIQSNWLQTNAPFYLVMSCLICIVLSIITVFIPAKEVLRHNPTETVRMNI